MKLAGNSVCRSPERPDLQLSQEEAYGRLVVDLVDGPTELVAKELREIGKRVDNKATREKQAKEKARQHAKDRRKNARTAARNNEEKAARLDATLAEIEVDCEAKLAARLATVVDLELPPENTVVHETRPATAAEEEVSAERKLRRLRKALAEAEEEVALADAHRVAARRALPGAERTVQEVQNSMLALRREHLLDLEREQSELDAEWEEWVLVRDAADSHLAQLRVLCVEAIEDLFARRQAALEARWAVEEAEAEKAAAAREKAQAAAREAEQAERAKLDREREQAWADLQAREAQAEALRAQLAALHCEPLQEQVRWEMPAETRDRLHAGAELVWGSAHRH